MPSQLQTEYFALAGGLNLVSPALEIPPGMLIDAVNFEPSISGGYSRMKGIERVDGRTRPSQSTYTLMTTVITVAGSIVVGNTVTGATSGATAVVLQVNSTTELVVTRVTGTFVAETLNVSAVAKGAVSSTVENGAATPILHATYKSLAADNYRASITAPPGSGTVRGVKYYNGDLYAFRNNAVGTACVMHKSTTAGWTTVTFGFEIQFTGAVGEVVEGNTVTGFTSGATGVVKRALLRSGTWISAGVGTLVFDSVTGTFQSGEALRVAAVTKVTSSSLATAITLAPGGKFVIENYNFSGTGDTLRMYGCDGVNPMFEFDGTRLVPIRTGSTPDTPTYLTIWQKMIVCAIRSSLQFSGVGQPYSYTALTGAAEVALGEVVTGLLPQQGDEARGSMATFTAKKTFMVYGTSTADVKFVEMPEGSGAQGYTQQNIGLGYYLDTKGVQQVSSTQKFGNFEMSTITRLIQPIIDAKRGLAVASCIVRRSNQYRIFFSDGTGIVIHIAQAEDGATKTSITQFDYGTTRYMNVIDSTVDATGVERIFAGGSDGYVYELDSGTSMDGSNIFAFMFLSFNSSKTPRSRKHYRRVILQASCVGVAQVNVGYDLSYAGSESDIGVRTLQTLIGGGGNWDSFTWDRFNWDSPVVQEYKVDTPGNGRNIGLLIYSDNAVDDEYTIPSAILNFSINRLER